MALVALVPVATANLTVIGIGDSTLLYDPRALPRLVTAAVLITSMWAVWWGASSRSDRPSIRVSPTLWALLAFFAWALVSLSLSAHWRLGILGQSDRLEGIVTLALYGLAYGIGLQVTNSGKDLRWLVGAFVTSCTVLAVYGLLQFAGIDPMSHELSGYTFDLRRAFATTGNPNFLAGVLLLAIPMGASLTASARRRSSAIAWGLASLLLAGALFATFTRTAWLVLILQGMLGAFLARRSLTRVPVRGLSLAATSLALLAALVAVSLSATGEVNLVTRLSQWGSASERALIAQTSVDAIIADPVTGSGPGAFMTAFRAHRSDLYAQAFGSHKAVSNAHSWPLQMAVTTGVPGASLFVLSIGLAFWVARNAFAVPRKPSSAWVATGIAVGGAGYCLYLMVNVAVLTSSIPFWFLMGAAAAPWARRNDLRRPLATSAAVVSAALALVVLLASVALVLADRAYMESRFAFHDWRAGDAVALADRALALNPTSIKYARGAAQAAARPAFRAIDEGMTEESMRELYARAAEAYERALVVDPYDYATLSQAAALHAAIGSHLSDPTIVAYAQELGQRATRLDRHAADVQLIATGDMGRTALMRAGNVAPMP